MPLVLRPLQLAVLGFLLAGSLGLVRVDGARVSGGTEPAFVRAALAVPGRAVADLHALQALPANYLAAKLAEASR